MTTKWTKGPWRVSKIKQDVSICGQLIDCFEIESEHDSCWIAQVQNHQGCVSTPEGPGNADLIAAAPEMYEALEAMIKGRVSENLHNAVHPSGRFCHVCGCNSKETVHSHGCPVKMAEAALAKARGEQA